MNPVNLDRVVKGVIAFISSVSVGDLVIKKWLERKSTNNKGNQ